MKIVYLFDEQSAFIEEYAAQLSPLDDPEDEVYITPICSTDIAPPAVEENEVAVFSDGVWTVTEDYRNAVVYDQSTGEEVKIEALGALGDNLGLTLPQIVIDARALVEFHYSVQTALDKVTGPSGVVMRCLIAGVTLPEEWKAWISAVRVLRTATTVSDIPATPDFPAGT